MTKIRTMGKHIIGFKGCTIIVAISLLFAATEAMQYDVGDSFGWNLPPNDTFYSNWARPKNFFAGDSLDVFNWTGNHNVADVTKEDYDNCTGLSPVIRSANRTELIMKLESAGPRYFICTIDDHCERGMKFGINVESAQPPSHDDNSASTLSYYGLFSAFLSAIATYFFACF